MSRDQFWLTKAQFSKIKEKGGEKSVHRPFARRPHDENPRADRHSMSPVCLHAHWRTSSRLHRWRGAARTASGLRHPARRQGLRANAIRQQVERRGTMPNIPPKANRKWKNCFSPFLYRNRNAIERMFCRLKDFRRVATRYDRNAVNFLAAVCIAAAVSYWL